MTAVGIWIAALLTLAIGSILWRQNPAFRLAEHILIGFTAGHLVVINYYNVLNSGIKPMIQDGRILNAIPIIIGLLFYMRFFKRFAWLTRIPLAFFFGISGAVGIVGALDASIRQQVADTVLPLMTGYTTPWGSFTFLDVNNAIIIAGTICTLTYFFMTKKHAGLIGGTAKVGRYFIMITLGARFGAVVISRMSLLYERLYFLLHEWMHVLK